MKHSILTVLYMTLGMSPLFAEKVEITSASMQAVNIKKQVHFTGAVKIKQGANWLNSDKVIVYFNENNETKKYEALGSVFFEFKKENSLYKGQSDKVVYFPHKSLYILTGHAMVDDLMNKRHISGDKINLDMISGNASVKSSKKNKPVKFIFDIGSK